VISDQEKLTHFPEGWKPDKKEYPIKRTDVKPCACGGSFRADRYAPADGMVHHHATKQHKAWREKEGL
jgi:hypothetical protein